MQKRENDKHSLAVSASSHRLAVATTAQDVDFRSSLYDVDPLNTYSGWNLSAQMIILIDELLLMDSRSILLHLPQHLEKRCDNVKVQLILPCKKYAHAVSLEDVDFAAVRSRFNSSVAIMGMLWTSRRRCCTQQA